MPETLSGIHVQEHPSDHYAVAFAPTSITAFIGRTVRGPLNDPVSVHSFHEFESIFGGLSSSSTLSYAIEQFFIQGGRHAIVVRVINGGKCATCSLPCRDSRLTLEAINRGAGELLRASVDYDLIGENEPDRFNLVLQRMSEGGLILDQEIHRRLSVESDSHAFVATVLRESNLMRVRGDVPRHRPGETRTAGRSGSVGYHNTRRDGDDGHELTDYDVIGCPNEGSGIFALKRSDTFNFLNIPPPSRNRDLRALSLIVAARYCRERGAILLVDPPRAWKTAQDAETGLAALNFRHQNAAMFFPQLVARDRQSGERRAFPPGAAIAGAISRADASQLIWRPGGGDLILRSGLSPTVALSTQDRKRLNRLGMSCLEKWRRTVRVNPDARTLAGIECEVPAWRRLAPRRIALFILASLSSSTRWVLFARDQRTTRKELTCVIKAFLHSLHERGVLQGRAPEEAYFVHCDVDGPPPGKDAPGIRVTILVGFALMRAGDFQAFTMTFAAGEATIRHCTDFRYTAVAV